jgi:nucleotide-binding universal stress UspA family protein
MTPFTSILLVADFSIDGDNAARRAALLAREHGARLNLLHVLDPTGYRPLRELISPSIDIGVKTAQTRDRLFRLAEEIAGRHGVTTRVELMAGEPLETMMLASQRADLLVLGRRAHGRFKAFLGERTVDRLLRTCRCPVLVVRTPVEGAYKHVLVPVDFTAPSEAAVQVAARLARDGGLHVFHAINSRRETMLRDTFVSENVIREFRMRLETGTIARMRRKAASLDLDSARVDFAVAHGHPAWSTLSHADRLGADLIVAGRQSRSAVGELLLGSVSNCVLAASRCDVMIVPRLRTEPVAPAALPQLRLKESTAQANVACAHSAAAVAGAWAAEQWHQTGARPLSRRVA